MEKFTKVNIENASTDDEFVGIENIAKTKPDETPIVYNSHNVKEFIRYGLVSESIKKFRTTDIIYPKNIRDNISNGTLPADFMDFYIELEREDIATGNLVPFKKEDLDDVIGEGESSYTRKYVFVNAYLEYLNGRSAGTTTPGTTPGEDPNDPNANNHRHNKLWDDDLSHITISTITKLGNMIHNPSPHDIIAMDNDAVFTTGVRNSFIMATKLYSILQGTKDDNITPNNKTQHAGILTSLNAGVMDSSYTTILSSGGESDILVSPIVDTESDGEMPGVEGVIDFITNGDASQIILTSDNIINNEKLIVPVKKYVKPLQLLLSTEGDDYPIPGDSSVGQGLEILMEGDIAGVLGDYSLLTAENITSDCIYKEVNLKRNNAGNFFEVRDVNGSIVTAIFPSEMSSTPFTNIEPIEIVINEGNINSIILPKVVDVSNATEIGLGESITLQGITWGGAETLEIYCTDDQRFYSSLQLDQGTNFEMSASGAINRTFTSAKMDNGSYGWMVTSTDSCALNNVSGGSNDIPEISYGSKFTTILSSFGSKMINAKTSTLSGLRNTLFGNGELPRFLLGKFGQLGSSTKTLFGIANGANDDNITNTTDDFNLAFSVREKDDSTTVVDIHGNKIENVAEGVEPLDGVNYSQLEAISGRITNNQYIKYDAGYNLLDAFEVKLVDIIAPNLDADSLTIDDKTTFRGIKISSIDEMRYVNKYDNDATSYGIIDEYIKIQIYEYSNNNTSNFYISSNGILNNSNSPKSNIRFKITLMDCLDWNGDPIADQTFLNGYGGTYFYNISPDAKIRIEFITFSDVTSLVKMECEYEDMVRIDNTLVNSDYDTLIADSTRFYQYVDGLNGSGDINMGYNRLNNVEQPTPGYTSKSTAINNNWLYAMKGVNNLLSGYQLDFINTGSVEVDHYIIRFNTLNTLPKKILMRGFSWRSSYRHTFEVEVEVSKDGASEVLDDMTLKVTGNSVNNGSLVKEFFIEECEETLSGNKMYYIGLRTTSRTGSGGHCSSAIFIDDFDGYYGYEGFMAKQREPKTGDTVVKRRSITLENGHEVKHQLEVENDAVGDREVPSWRQVNDLIGSGGEYTDLLTFGLVSSTDAPTTGKMNVNNDTNFEIKVSVVNDLGMTPGLISTLKKDAIVTIFDKVDSSNYISGKVVNDVVLVDDTIDYYSFELSNPLYANSGSLSGKDVMMDFRNDKYTQDYNKIPLIPQATDPTPHVEGSIFYSQSKKSAVVQTDGKSHILGRELWIRVVNGTGVALDVGDVVYLKEYNTTENLMSVGSGNASSKISSTNIVIVNEPIAIGAIGECASIGMVTGFDTSAYTNGDTLYASASGDRLRVTTEPTFPNYSARIGKVGKISASDGSMYVNVDTDPKFGGGIAPSAGGESFPIILSSGTISLSHATNQGGYWSTIWIPRAPITVHEMSVFCDQLGVNYGLRMGIYSQGNNDVLLAQTVLKSDPFDLGVITLSLESPLALPANVPVMLAVQCSSNGVRFANREGTFSPNSPNHFARVDGQNAPTPTTGMSTVIGYSKSTTQIWIGVS